MLEFFLAGQIIKAVTGTSPMEDLLGGGGNKSGSKYNDGLVHGHCRYGECSCIFTGQWVDRFSKSEFCPAAPWRKCRPCGGKGFFLCETCRGSGEVDCGTCGGSGLGPWPPKEVGSDGREFQPPQPPCSGCGGSGKVMCPTCGGKGRKDCVPCKGRGEIPGLHWPWRHPEPVDEQGE